MTHILIAEDDRFLAAAYRAKFTKAGFDAVVVGNGEEALTALAQAAPDLILLDLVMPGKDGFSTLEDIRRQDQYRDIPIIVTSNLGQKEDLDRAKSLGADDYLIKSDLSLDALVAKIKTMLGLPDGAAAAPGEPSAAAAEGPESPTAEETPASSSEPPAPAPDPTPEQG